MVADNGDRYQLPCDQLDNYQCVDQIIKDMQQIEPRLEKNKVLLTRYQIALKKPDYFVYTFVAEAPFPSYMSLMYASQLRLAQAVLLMDRGDVEQGLDILHGEIKFYKEMLLTKGLLIDSMIAIRQLLISYFVVSGLLDHPQLKPHLYNSKLVALAQPLSMPEQQSLVSVFKKEQAFMVVHSYLMGDYYEQEHYKTEDFADVYKEKNVYIEQAKVLGYSLTFDRVATINAAYNKVNGLINKASYTLPIASLQYFFEMADNASSLSFDEVYLKYGRNNLWGGILLEKDTLSPYLLRLYDLNIYALLLQTKLMIKQSALSKQQVCGFLDRLERRNPYTTQLFTWDAKR